MYLYCKNNKMKIVVVIWTFLGLFCLSSCSDRPADKNQERIMHMEAENFKENKKLRHVVLFKFKKTATEIEIVKIKKAFADLPSKIEQIKGFEWGLNISPENLNKGFTHGFLLTFNSEKDRDLYLSHPDHKAFGEIVEPILEDVLVVDYWTN